MEIFVATSEGGIWKKVENLEIWVSDSTASGINNRLRLVRIDDIAAIKFPDGVIFDAVLLKRWWKPITWWRHQDPNIKIEVK